jgi:hypothetical protein
LSCLLFIQLLRAALLLAGEHLPSPEEYLGFPPGADGRLASFEQIVGYFRELERGSSCIAVRELGRTTLGRPFVLVLISSPENMRRLAEIRAVQGMLADPRRTPVAQADSLIRRVPAVVSVNCSIHATEVGASQMAPRLVHELLSGQLPGWQMILDSVLVLLIPSHNPDGLARVKEWCDRTAGTPYAGSSPPWLGHPYAGHDNNRDWFVFTQPETQLTVDSVYNVWHPQIVLDMHQMGGGGARLFVPPYLDPIDPRVDPELVAAMNELGAFVQARFTELGLGGAVSSAYFDAYTPARAYPNYHGAIRFLSEVASCRLAEPLILKRGELRGEGHFSPDRPSSHQPLVWPGGRWSLANVLTYHETVAHSVLLHAAMHRTRWVKRSYRVLQRQCQWQGAPAAFLIPERQWDPSATRELLAILRRGGLEIFRTQEGWVVPVAQPYGSFALTLLEAGEYRPPANEPSHRPYDVTAHSLPLLFGVLVKPLDHMIPEAASWEGPGPVVPLPESPSATEALLLDGRANGSFRLVARALRTGLEVRRLESPRKAGGRFFPAGSFAVTGNPSPLEDLSELAQKLSVVVAVASREQVEPAVPVRLVRAGVYQSWVPSVDEGWTRWVLDEYEFPYVVLHDADVRAGIPDSLELVLVPELSPREIVDGWSREKMAAEYAGGIGREGVEKLGRFVARGGTLVLVGSAVGLADEYLGLDLCEEGSAEDTCFIPGALLRAVVTNLDVCTWGMPQEFALMATHPPRLRGSAGRALVSFASDSLLLSGWGTGLGLIRGRPALLEAKVGAGRILAYAFRPLFRGWSRATYKLLLNAWLAPQ